jgi:hypothetical protein
MFRFARSLLVECENEQKIKLAERRNAKLNELYYKYKKDLEQVNEAIDEYKMSPDGGPSAWALKMNRQVHRHAGTIKIDSIYLDLLERRTDLKETLAKIERVQDSTRKMVSESAPVSDVVEESKVSLQQNVMDIGGMDPFYRSVGASRVPNVGLKETLPMAKFLERPVEIDTFEVKVGDQVAAEYKLWDILSLDPTNRAKLRNYAYFHGTIRVRIAVSGTPFHSGKFLVSYQPYPLRNTALQALLSGLTAAPLGVYDMMRNYLSQAPGAITIDVKMNQPIEIEIPFISPKAMYRLFNTQNTVVSGVTSFVDFANAGSLFFYTLNLVRAVSPTPAPIAVQIYAWFENVTLGTATATQIAIVTESGMVAESGDERVSGPVERISSALATASRALTAVPGISELARASSYVFEGAAGVAAWFGWSRPHIVSQPVFMKNRPYVNSCVGIGSDTTEKVTLDPLQELVVDPRVAAVDMDELAIAHISSIETFLTIFDWDITDLPMVNPIFKCMVTPNLLTFYDDTVGTKRHYQPTAMAFAAAPFIYWRGAIRFRFEIVCSEFHRGKLAFFYEPNINHASLIDLNVATNKNFLKIVDIQETTSVEFCVHWAQPRMWNFTTPLDAANQYYGATFDEATPRGEGYVNGYIGVVPFTELQSPVDPDLVQVNVYVSGEDLQFNYLSDELMPSTRMMITESGDSEGPIIDNMVSCIDLNESTGSAANSADYFFGEQPLSFRTALKRYTQSATGTVSALASNTSVLLVSNIMVPPSPKFDGVAETNRSILKYLPYAFLAARGGMRKHVRIVNAGASANSFISGNQSCMSASDDFVHSGSTGFTSSGGTNGYARCLQSGSVLCIPSTNGGLEFELPYYSNNLFHFSCANDWIGTNGTGEMTTEWMKYYNVRADLALSADTTVRYVEESAAAEDFTFMHYLGAPYYSIDY